MKNRRKRKAKEQTISFRNHERYSDPTAYLAVRNIVRKEKTKN